MGKKIIACLTGDGRVVYKMGKVFFTPEKKQRIKNTGRELSHLFIKSGNLAIAIEHFLVSFPSMLLMAKTMTAYNFSVNSISLLLFSAFVSNLIFIVLTDGKIPVFIGPSFAFVKELQTKS